MKKLLSILLAVVLLISFAACGASSTSSVPAASSSTVAASSGSNVAAQSSGEEKLSGTVTFLCGETDEEQVEVVKNVIANFEKDNPGCTIDLVLSGYDDREQQILTELYAGGTVDIITVDGESFGAYTQADLLYPLDDLIQAIGADDFVDGSRVIVNGHDYAMPYATGSMMLFVRTDLLAAKGLKTPTTWEELLDVAEKMTGDGMYGMCLPAGTNNATELYFDTFCELGGNTTFDKDCMPIINDDQIKDTLKFYTDLCKYCPEGITSYGYGDQISAFLSGSVAMTIYQGRPIARIFNEAPDLIGKYDVVPIPTGHGLTTEDIQYGVVTYFAVGKGCQNPALAQAFLQYLCTGQNAVDFAMSAPGHLIPSLYSVADLLDEYLDTSDEEIVKTCSEYIKKSVAHAIQPCNLYEVANAGGAYHGKIEKTGIFNTNYAYIRSYNIFSEMVQRVLINGEDVNTVCDEAQQKLLDIIAENN